MRSRPEGGVRRLPAAAPRRQSGVALLALLTLLTLWGLYLLVGELNVTQFQVARKEAAGAALAQAKLALIGRAAGDDNRPGSLPCPAPVHPDATHPDGVALLLAGNHCPIYVGRLPWRTLQIEQFRDVGDTRINEPQGLWYALAPALRDDDSAQPINFETVPELRLDGAPNVAAIIFAPGLPLANQNRDPRNERGGDSVADYLDGSNADGDQDFVSGPQSAAFNDVVLAVTRDDLFRVVNQRVLGEVRARAESASLPDHGLLGYQALNGRFPFADGDTDGSADSGVLAGRLPYRDLSFSPAALAWLTANDWWRLVSYNRLSACLALIGIVGSAATMDVSGAGPACP
ncbi:hypothetical protein [Accumulibacter sp.]|uniref:hypothetical protein n=1 Tax=Accumulibacter sp. TaxID=2053492 RepID=UPI0025E80B72|nr:hypothetical protein [Accumulibacter sp.]MCM8613355.1 hypothetical protein [Accumulibacter sp.]MCM8637002.1 hypothetical protein [Accumulibacter sp.]MCM8641876.1 hypothetical protein [Accumulibacter sp.]